MVDRMTDNSCFPPFHSYIFCFLYQAPLTVLILDFCGNCISISYLHLFFLHFLLPLVAMLLNKPNSLRNNNNLVKKSIILKITMFAECLAIWQNTSVLGIFHSFSPNRFCEPLQRLPLSIERNYDSQHGINRASQSGLSSPDHSCPSRPQISAF